MQLPNSAAAYIQLEKLTGYLLSEEHRDGGAKAKFFKGFGFDETNVEKLREALLHIARNIPPTEVIDSAYGTKYVIVGAIESPLGRMVTILTVWIIDSGTTAPRFVTARPYKMQN